MDGVPVFVTRNLFPPSDVDIPDELFQAFQVDNDTISSETQSYDFTLERYVCTKINEWVHNTEIDRMNRDERIRLKEVERTRQMEEKHKQLLTAVRYDDFSSEEDDSITESKKQSGRMFSPSHINFDTILQPTIVPSQANYSSSTINSSKLLNYSDFETIESSPFDNVELKTINDLDILAQVLQSTTVKSTTSTSTSPEEELSNKEDGKVEGNVNKSEMEYGAANVNVSHATTISPPVFPPFTFPHQNGSLKTVKQQHQLIPDILKGLNNEILQSETRRRSQYEKEHPNVKFSPKNEVNLKEQEKPKQYNSEQQFTNLSPKSQSLVNSICQMGFPMERVINVVEKLGEEEKDIVDHLIPLCELLDLGFEEQKISEALLKFDNNKEKALDFLIS